MPKPKDLALTMTVMNVDTYRQVVKFLARLEYDYPEAERLLGLLGESEKAREEGAA
jgi:hypothetical protein